MSKEISLDIFDITTVKSAIKELETYAKKLEKKANMFVKILGEDGIGTIKAGYASAMTDGDTDLSDISVTMTDVSHGTVTVKVDGHAVLFLEFGTGPLNPDNPIARASLTSGNVLEHGEYSKILGFDRIDENGQWEYKDSKGNKVVTTGLPAQSIVFNSMQEVKAKVEKLAKAVFFND